MTPRLAAVLRSRSLAMLLALTGCSRTQPDDAKSSPPTAAATPAPAAPEPPPNPQLTEGAELYGRMCAVCHGAKGEGYVADNATMLAQPDFLASASDNYLGFSIAEGRPGSVMSAWLKSAGGPLSFDQIRSLIAFMRTWQKTPAVSLNDAAVSGDATRGKEIFTRECERCHGVNGPQVRIQGRFFLGRATNGFLRHALHTGRPPTPMLSYATTLGEAGIEDVIAYLRTLPKLLPGEPLGGYEAPLPLGPVPLNPKGREPKGFQAFPKMTPVATVGPALAKNARMVLLDARVPSDYQQQHIAGAVSVPFYDPSPYLDKLPKDAWLVCYCGCPHAESGQLAQKLMAAGFSKVTVLDEGLFVWLEKGYPMSQGRTP